MANALYGKALPDLRLYEKARRSRAEGIEAPVGPACIGLMLLL